MAASQTARQFDSELAKLATEVTMAAQAADVTKVRYQKAALQSLESLGAMQNIMDAALKGDRAEFLKVFGGDCRRVAMKRARVEQLQVLLANSSHAADPRPQRSVKFCQSVEDVLASVDLNQALGAAQLQARKRIETALANQEAQVAPEDVGDVSPTRMDQLPVACINSESRATLLKDLDDADTYVEARAIVEGLFEVYDTDGNGVLEGEEAEKAINDLVKHVMREGDERSSKFGGMKVLPSEEAVRAWVWLVVDKDGDKKITPDEAIQGFVRVVDEIDEQEERPASMTKRASLPHAEAGHGRRCTL